MRRPSEDQILAAAERVFGERGYGDTSLRDLLSAAEVSTTAFYARFASKEAVLAELVQRLLVDLHDAAARALPRARDVATGWDEGVDLLVAALSGRRGLVRVALTDAARVPGPREALSGAYAMLAMLMAQQLSRQAARGRIDVADPEALAWAIVGAMKLQVVRWAVFEQLDDAQLADQLRRCARALLPKAKETR
jgi:AcrR family transcriptional regulator